MIIAILLLLIIIFISSIKIENADIYNLFSNGKVNAIRGFCASFIIFHHICISTSDLYIVLKPIQYLGFITVSIFFFYSGYGLTCGRITKGDKYFDDFWKKRGLALLVPYLTIILIYAIYTIFNGTFNAQEYIVDIILAKEIGPLWYMSALLIMYIFYYFTQKYMEVKKGTKALFICISIYTLILIILKFPSIWYSSVFSFWFGTFYRVNYEKIYKFLNKDYKKKIIILILLFVIFFVGRLAISYFGFETEYFHAPYRNILSILFDIIIVMITMKMYLKNRILDFCGQISYELYLVHPFVIKIFENKITANSINILLIVIISFIVAWGLNMLNQFIKVKVGKFNEKI